MCSRRETSSATKNPQDVTIALNCQPATCTNNEKKKRKILSLLRRHSQKFPPRCLQPPSFCTWTNCTILPCPWTLLLLPHLLPANLPVTTSFFKCQDLDCIPIPSGLDHFWPWGTPNSTSSMEPPQLPMALTLPGAVCNFPPPCHTWKGEMRASPTPIRALEIQVHQEYEIPHIMDGISHIMDGVWYSATGIQATTHSPLISPVSLWYKTGLACIVLPISHWFWDPVTK